MFGPPVESVDADPSYVNVVTRFEGQGVLRNGGGGGVTPIWKIFVVSLRSLLAVAEARVRISTKSGLQPVNRLNCVLAPNGTMASANSKSSKGAVVHTPPLATRPHGGAGVLTLPGLTFWLLIEVTTIPG